jgi:hypothetical protein
MRNDGCLLASTVLLAALPARLICAACCCCCCWLALAKELLATGWLSEELYLLLR